MVQSRCEHAVVADRKAFQIPQALAAAQNPEHRNQQQVPGRDANAPSHARIRSEVVWLFWTAPIVNL